MRSLRKIHARLGRAQEGWVLVEAIMSAVVVILGFTAATVAFNSGNRTAAHDVDKSGAMAVAQTQLEKMRAVGQEDIPTLLAMNGTSKTITSGGNSYTVTYTANYTDSLGGSNTDSCGSFSTSGANGAAYVFMKVSVTYPNMVDFTSSGGSTSPIVMQSYFAPEGGSSQAKTATLKVYVLNLAGTPLSGSPQVSLHTGGAGGPVVKGPTTVNSNGCVLFTGLGSDTYTITVPTSGMQDMYMRVASGTYQKDVDVPARAAMVQKIQVAAPITVTPTYKVYANSTDAISSTPTAVTIASANSFVNDTLGTNSGKGLWVAQSGAITAVKAPDYTINPGKVFMPHYQNSSTAALMYPDPAGYSAYAGGCDVNNPAGQGGSSQLTQVPLPADTSLWIAGGSYSPSFWLGKITTPVQISGTTSSPNQALASHTYYWNQKLTGFTVQAMLTGDDTGTTPTNADCGPRPGLYNNWVTLGSYTNASGTTNPVELSNDLESLPAGQYSVCVIANYAYSVGVTTNTYSGGKYTWASGYPKSNQADSEYELDTGNQVVPQTAPVGNTVTMNNVYPNSTTVCGS